MNQFQGTDIISNPSLRDRAKGALAGRYGQAVLAFFLVWLISSAVRLALSVVLTFLWSTIAVAKEIMIGGMSQEMLYKLLEDPSYLNPYQVSLNLTSIGVGVIASIYLGVFHVGLCLYCLNVACNRPAGITDIFYGFKYQFRKSLKLAAAYTLAEQFFLVPANILVYLIKCDTPNAVMNFFLGLTAAGLIISCCLLLHIFQCFYLMLDFPNYDADELLHLSSHIMKGHKMRAFLLLLSFVPLLLLSLLSFCIGNLWLVPYFQMTQTFFFLNMMQARSHDS